tara:strand:- start:40 stop:180 length:141 start_codon:yes stop_codon:yes gene_type:complete
MTQAPESENGKDREFNIINYSSSEAKIKGGNDRRFTVFINDSKGVR